MSIYRRKSGRWQVSIDLPPSPTGGRRRRKLGTFATRKEAERAQRQALEAKDRGIDLDPRKVTLADVAIRFLRAVGPDLAPSTIARYEEHWRMHIAPTLGGIAVASLKAAHLAELYATLRSEKIRYQKGDRVRFGRPLGGNSVLRIHRLLHRMFGWAERLGLVQRNLARLVESPKAVASPARALTAEQVERVLGASEGTTFHRLFVLLAETGMRRGEAGAVTWDAIDFENATILVRQAIGQDRKGRSFIKGTKSGRERTVPISAVALEALKRQKAAQAAEKLAAREGAYEDGGLVFADSLGRLPDLNAVTKAFADVLRSLGLKKKGVSLHSLRHFVGTVGLASGSDVRTISDLLGHADPSVTLRVYAHAVPGAKERAVASITDALAQAKARRLAGQN